MLQKIFSPSGDIKFGNCFPDVSSLNVARVGALLAGIPDTVPASSINRVCTSGMSCVHDAVMSISAGYQDVMLVGGVENMSSAPYILPTARWGTRCVSSAGNFLQTWCPYQVAGRSLLWRPHSGASRWFTLCGLLMLLPLPHTLSWNWLFGSQIFLIFWGHKHAPPLGWPSKSFPRQTIHHGSDGGIPCTEIQHHARGTRCSRIEEPPKVCFCPTSAIFFSSVFHSAERATKEGRFAAEIVPIEVKQKKKKVLIDKDDHFRTDLKLEELQGLPPAFIPKVGNMQLLVDFLAVGLFLSGFGRLGVLRLRLKVFPVFRALWGGGSSTTISVQRKFPALIGGNQFLKNALKKSKIVRRFEKLVNTYSKMLRCSWMWSTENFFKFSFPSMKRGDQGSI